MYIPPSYTAPPLFLHRGSICGNTHLSFYKGRLAGNSKSGSNLVFEVAFALYYRGISLIRTPPPPLGPP